MEILHKKLASAEKCHKLESMNNELLYSKRLDTDEGNKLFIGAFGNEYYQAATATQPNTVKGAVRIFVARNSAMTALSRSALFPRKEMRAKHMHKFMAWAANEDFSGKTVDEIISRLKVGHENASVIGAFHF